MKESSEIIKTIIYNCIKKEYENYTKNNNILIISDEKLYDVLSNSYDNNIKKLKNDIRNELKEFYKENYNQLATEQLILDIFQDKETSIKKASEQIKFIQDKNLKIINIPIINNSLNMNIGIDNNYIIINSTNIKKIESKEYTDIYNTINKYKFLYSINDKILENYNNKVDFIKNEINDKTEIKIGIYYLKKIDS
tara:strand:+ start:822 stop:1406 length:585 start_codon:yes stop_codon:yes gene_type:complete